MEKQFQKILQIDLKDDEATERIVKALNCRTRRQILRLLEGGSMGIWEIATQLNLPLSTVSEHTALLLKAGIVSVVRKTSDRGHGKILSRQYEQLAIHLVPPRLAQASAPCFTLPIPIGSYSSFQIKKYCGMLNSEGYIGQRDDPDTFFSPQRFSAGLLWFDCGYLEYKIPLQNIPTKTVTSLSLAVELCSEAPGYNENWKSDIFFQFNGKTIGTYTSPGDFGARNGYHTPKWWKDGTKYGIRKVLEIRKNGSYLDGDRLSDVTLDDLALGTNPLLTLRIGVEENAKHRGGMNLFGRSFGDYGSDLLLTFTCGTSYNTETEIKTSPEP